MVYKHNIQHNVMAKVMNEWFVNITYNTKVMNEWFVNITYNTTSRQKL